MYKTPILFIIFNRPEQTKAVFEQIRLVKPTYLFVAADGPRPEVAGEQEKCEETRKIIEQVDWECDVQKLYRANNNGCAKGVSGAITWFFNHVERGVILEDDCLPDPTFFSFCEELLIRYEDDKDVMQISGYNMQLGIERSKYSYYFSKFPNIWGWATWKKAWSKFEYHIDTIDESVLNKESIKYWKDEINEAFSGKLDSWGFRWLYTFAKNNYTCIYPNVSLIKNIGVGESASHTNSERWWYKHIKYGQVRRLKHPGSIIINMKADAFANKINKALPLSIQDRIMRNWYQWKHRIAKHQSTD